MRSRTGRARKLAIVVAGVTVACGIAAGPAMGAKFGAKLTGASDPFGANPAHKCLPASGGCTRAGVNYTATGAIQGNVTAPDSGKIKRVRLIAATQGNFRLMVLKLNTVDLTTGTALGKAKKKGPRLSYQGNGLTSKPIEHFKLKPGIRVKQGDYLGIRARKTSTLDCHPTTVHQVLFQPPLGLGGGFVASRAFDNCQLLIQAIIK
jgi:hypothetical protein